MAEVLTKEEVLLSSL